MKIYKIILAIILGFIIVIFLLNLPLYHSQPSLLEINYGMSSSEISKILKEKNLIRNRYFFQILSIIFGASKKLKAGIYEIKGTDSTIDILLKILKGKVYTKQITIPEGFNMHQITELLSSQGIVDKYKFWVLLSDKELLKKYKIDSKILEGYLFPGTYFFTPKMEEKNVIEIMLHNFFNTINSNYINRAKEIGLSLNELVILASLVEKEAKVDLERPIIARIFLSRYRKKMRLESCATILYALKKHKVKLSNRDLKIGSKYNTYIHPGLPPTPICSPGLKAILSVLFPASVDYLYFVSKNDGTHHFSKTYKDHMRAKRIYQPN